jgi:hypothetical protein
MLFSSSRAPSSVEALPYCRSRNRCPSGNPMRYICTRTHQYLVHASTLTSACGHVIDIDEKSGLTGTNGRLEARCGSAPAKAERVAGGIRVDLEALGRLEVIGRFQEPRAQRDGFLMCGLEVVDP